MLGTLEMHSLQTNYGSKKPRSSGHLLQLKDNLQGFI